MKTLKEHEPIGDTRLVELCLIGDRDAFAQVVGRYQSLICCIAYSACGDVGRSEDLAQDTFVTAWKNLDALKEPAKLKNWLCGIARNLINNSVRRESRTPTAHADPLQSELLSEDASPHDHAVSREEEFLVWRALETIPADYRETMVLFYREGQSTQAVAAALDLSVEAVRQRLSRGRVMLNERVAKTVESALFRSSPGKVFTIGVLTAMPAFAISAKAATLGATAAKGSTAAKAAAATGLVGAILGPLFSIFGMWVGFRMNIEAAQTDRERDHIAGFYRGLIASILGFAAVYFLLMCYARQLMESHHQVFIGLVIGLALAYTIAIAALSMWSLRKRREILATMTVREMATDPTRSVLEYRSSFRLMGLPFIHIRIGDRLAPPVKAWIAMGGSAFGVLFAFGGLAVAPVSIGGCAVGLFSFGGLAIGALALGGFGLGVWCFGGMALGWQAFGGCALAWDSAFGGVAIARDFALGGLAHAAQVNNDAAGRHLGGFAFFRYSQLALPYVAWMNLLWIVPMLGCRGVIARRAKRPATVALVGCFAALTLRAATPQEPASIPVTQSDRTESSSSERFDDLVRDDFFAGTLKGDRASFDRAMKLCEDALAKNPKHAQALVWHGSGLLYLSGLSFQSNDVPKGLELWRRGLKEMDGAVALEPDNVAVLIPRAATLLPISKYVPNPDESRQLLKTGVADYEKVLELQKAYFGKLSVHAQGELLFGIADGWFRLGEIDRSQKYLRRIAQELPGSNYAVRASDWLQTTDTAALQKKSAAMSCVGCHTP